MGKTLTRGREYRLIRSNPHEGFYPDTPIYGRYVGKRKLTYNHTFYGKPVRAQFSVFKAGSKRKLITGVTHHVEHL